NTMTMATSHHDAAAKTYSLRSILLLWEKTTIPVRAANTTYASRIAVSDSWANATRRAMLIATAANILPPPIDHSARRDTLYSCPASVAGASRKTLNSAGYMAKINAQMTGSR